MLDLGVNKAIVAARRIGEIDPYLRVETVPEGIHADNLGNFLDGLDLVIEECDSLDVKLLVREMARERRIPVLMETSDRGVLDVERFDLEPNRPIFHGLLGSTKSSELAGLTLAEKAPYVLRMLGAEDVSSRGAASLPGGGGRSRHRMATARQRGHARRRDRRRRRTPDRLGRGAPLGSGPL